MTTGQRIKEARIKAGVTQQELADKLGISFVGISQWEHDKRKPKQETLIKIAKALGVHLKDLVDNSIWEEFDKKNDVKKITEEVKIIELVEHHFGKSFTEIFESYEQLNSNEWERFSSIIYKYAKLDTDDRNFFMGRIIQLLEDMLNKNKYPSDEINMEIK